MGGASVRQSANRLQGTVLGLVVSYVGLVASAAFWPDGGMARDAALVEARALRALEGVDRVIAFHCAWQEGGHLHSQLELCALGSLRQLVDALDDSVAGLEEDPYLSRLLGDAGDALAHVRAGNNNGPVQTSPSRSRRRRFGRLVDESMALGECSKHGGHPRVRSH